MNRFASALPILALACAPLLAGPLYAQPARDFQLPPAATPSPDSSVQGPVDTDTPVPVRPRAIETARPAPTATASAPPAIVLPAPAPAQTAAPARAPAARPTVPQRPASGEPEAAVAAPQASPLPDAAAVTPLPLPSASNAAPPLATAPPGAPAEALLPWLWIVLGGLVLAAGAAALAWRRRFSAAATPQFVAPRVAAAAPGEALVIAVEAMRMDRSVLNATVGYRVTIRNRTAQALNAVAVEADLISASRDRPAEQQLASPEQALAPRHSVGRLAPGQSLRLEGQVRLPLAEASAIWQGGVGLLVPLLRVRAIAAGAAPVATTLVIGRAEGSSTRPQPFRLDEPPRSYAPLAQRVLDAVPAGV